MKDKPVNIEIEGTAYDVHIQEQKSGNHKGYSIHCCAGEKTPFHIIPKLMKFIEKKFVAIGYLMQLITLPEMHCVDVQNFCKGIQDYEKERQDNKKDVMEPSSEGAVGGEARDDGVSKAATKTLCDPEQQKCFNPIYAEEMVWHLQSGATRLLSESSEGDSVFNKFNNQITWVIGEEPNGVVYQVLTHGPQSLLVELIRIRTVKDVAVYLTRNEEPPGGKAYATGDIQGQSVEIGSLTVFKFTEDEVKSAKAGGEVYVRVTFYENGIHRHQTFIPKIKIGPDIVLTIPL
eukprot:GHVS01008416.1.p1 GENE.GHVS01008416.1~~GHVS01008416.1.p1  ORF type:complete len:289 (-),score=13.79 GHVS01008416.1:342-1208(-)